MTIYDYITEQKTKYLKQIELEDGWFWSMRDHLRRSFLYLNSQFEDNNQDRDLRPNKNIVLPIMNVQYRTEGFDVKDIEIYVNSSKNYYKSFVIKKKHHNWALEKNMDGFIDDLVEEYANYGGVLVRKTEDVKPEVIDLRTIEFCNQTDILNFPFCIKHSLSFKELKEMKGKWGEDKNGATIDIDTLITLVKKEEKDEVEVFEIHGVLPHETDEDLAGENQIQVVAYYKREDGEEQGVILFKKREPELPFKFLPRDKIKGRALGRGGVEELFEPQMWTNWNEVKTTEMLNSASKTLFYSDDPKFKTNNNLSNVDNNEVFNLQEGKNITQLDTYPRNLAVFNDSLERWRQQAQTLGSAQEPLQGESPASGTPFKLYEAQLNEGKGLHEYRKGKIASFVDEIYRDWIMPHFKREIIKDQEFLSELSADEMLEISRQVARNRAEKRIVEQVLNGQIPDDREEVSAQEEQSFRESGNKKFFKIIKEEFREDKLDVFTNIAGKQKNLALLTDKLVNVIRQYIATPEIRQDPGMNKLLNTILESSGLSPIMFSLSPVQQQPQLAGAGQKQGGGSTEAIQDLAENQQEQ